MNGASATGGITLRTRTLTRGVGRVRLTTTAGAKMPGGTRMGKMLQNINTAGVRLFLRTCFVRALRLNDLRFLDRHVTEYSTLAIY